MQSRLSQPSVESCLTLPKKQEWAIIYDHRARELEQAKSMEKLLSQQKKDNLKRQLDDQIHSKRSVGRAEKQEDRRYYERVLQQAQQLKEKQEREKFEMYVKHKSLEQANIRIYEAAHDPKLKQSKRVYNIQFGLQSQQEKKERADAIKKDVIQTVEKQLQYKEEEKKIKRQQEIELDAKNVQYQLDLFNSRSQNQKKYEQNQGVYNYYKDLHAQRVRRDRDLQHKLVDEVHNKKQEEANRKKQLDAMDKERKNIEIKDTLQRQIQLLHQKKQDQSRTNPQQNNYSFFNSIFRERKATVDKKQYNSYLEKQAEQQKQNKLQQHYMSEEEYRLNANQLNKAISGQYTYDRYYDRSVGTLGDKLNLQKVDPLQSQDAELVKTKLENLRTRRNRSTFENRNELNQSLF